MASRGARGAAELRAVARDLRTAAGSKGMRARLRKNITVAMQPLKAEVQRNAFNIPSKGTGHTGLRVALMRATRIRVAVGVRAVTVGLIVDGKKMPAGQQALPQYMEGEKRWRHPVEGNREVWVDQESHPFVAPAVPHHLAAVDRGVTAAVAETAQALAKGTH